MGLFLPVPPKKAKKVACGCGLVAGPVVQCANKQYCTVHCTFAPPLPFCSARRGWGRKEADRQADSAVHRYLLSLQCCSLQLDSLAVTFRVDQFVQHTHTHTNTHHTHHTRTTHISTLVFARVCCVYRKFHVQSLVSVGWTQRVFAGFQFFKS